MRGGWGGNSSQHTLSMLPHITGTHTELPYVLSQFLRHQFPYCTTQLPPPQVSSPHPSPSPPPLIPAGLLWASLAAAPPPPHPRKKVKEGFLPSNPYTPPKPPASPTPKPKSPPHQPPHLVLLWMAVQHCTQTQRTRIILLCKSVCGEGGQGTHTQGQTQDTTGQGRSATGRQPVRARQALHISNQKPLDTKV